MVDPTADTLPGAGAPSLAMWKAIVTCSCVSACDPCGYLVRDLYPPGSVACAGVISVFMSTWHS